MAHQDTANPCAEFGPTQRAALLWFVGTIIGGTILVVWLCRLDHKIYTDRGEVLNYRAYTQNRKAHYGISSEFIDPRARGDLSTAAARTSQD